jgi:hypothetical protein
MTTEEFLEKVKYTKGLIKYQEEELEKIKNSYIESNKPCDIDQKITIKRTNGRTTTGKAHAFGILYDKKVYVTAIKPDKGAIVYISVPYAEIQLL